MIEKIGMLKKAYKDAHFNGWLIFFTLIYIVLTVKIITLQRFETEDSFIFYSIAISIYILSRFVLGQIHQALIIKDNVGYQPSVSFAIPCKDEEENISKTIQAIADVDYPKDKYDIFVVNDGSTDNSLAQIEKKADELRREGVKITVIDFKVNQGKREGMRECIVRSNNELMILIDSDSFVDKKLATNMAKYFVDPRVAAVSGHTDVYNKDVNNLTKLQNVRYYIAFKVFKAAESLFGCVTCCSGCCSAYRRSAVMEVLDDWSNQTFLGVKCTYGDDRSLTNYLLEKNYRTHYAPDAKSYTVVPEDWSTYIKQQQRWKKSWVRESFRASKFMWRKNPVVSTLFYLGLMLPMISPIVVVRAFLWIPIVGHKWPTHYLFGLLIMSMVCGIYYYIHTKGRDWFVGVAFVSIATLFLLWQLPWAVITIRNPKWGTR